MKQIWTLTRMQLGSTLDFINIKRSKNKKKSISTGLVMLLGVALFAFISGFYNYAMGQVMMMLGQLDVLPGFFMAITCIIILFTSIYKVNGILYRFKDYDILMALPVKTSIIVASRLMLLYIINLIFTVGLLVPNFIVYAILAKPQASFYVFGFIALWLTPLVPMIIASILGLFVAFISSRFKNSNAMGTVLMICLTIGILFGSFFIQDDSQLVNLSIGLRDMMTTVYPLSALYLKGIVEADVISFLAFVFISLAAFAVFSIVFGRLFRWLNSKLGAIHATSKYRLKELKQNGQFGALYKKELKRYLSCSIYFMNTGIALIILLVIAVALPFLGEEKIASLIEIPQAASMIRTIAPYFISLIGGTAAITASSISLEGKNLWILKSAPIKASTLLNAKLCLQMSFTMPVCLITSISFAFSLKMSLSDSLATILIPQAYCYLQAVFGLWLNMQFPLLEWKNEAVVVKQSVSSMCAIFGGMLISGLPILIHYLIKDVDTVIVQSAICIFVVLLSALLHQILMKTGQVKMDRL